MWFSKAPGRRSAGPDSRHAGCSAGVGRASLNLARTPWSNNTRQRLPTTTVAKALAATMPFMDGFLQTDLWELGSSVAAAAGSLGRPSAPPATGPGRKPEGQQQQQPAIPLPWRLLSSTPLAGGVLHVVQWEGPRNIRVWLPPGHNKDEARNHPYPVLYCNDGQNMFGDCATLSGNSWRVAHTAAELIQSGKLPPFMVVGLDHAGPLRSLEYTPYTPGTGPGGFRSDAAQWPGGGVAAYLARIQQEVLPWVAREYGASLNPNDLALAGSSFGGVAALAAGMSSGGQGGGCAFGALLVESPSMWVADEAFLKDVTSYSGSWPQRVYLGMGGKEYSGVRRGRGREHDAHFPRYLKSLYASLTEQGLGPDRLAWTYDPTAAHTESAWAERLPEALAFVGQGWWDSWVRKQGAAGQGLVTSPGQLRGGEEGQLLFFNRMASSTLARLPQGTRIKVSMGVDGWKQVQQLELEPLSQGLTHHIDPPAQLQQEVFEQWGLDPELQADLHKRLLATVKSSAAPAGGSGGEWWVLRVPPPPWGCSRLDMAFCDGSEKVWDNNNQQDYHLSVSPAPSASPQHSPSTGLTRGVPAVSRGGGTIALVSTTPAQDTTIKPSAAIAAAAKTPVQSFSTRAETAQGAASTVLRMLESLRICAIGDGCGFINPEALDRAEFHVLHGANAPAQDAATAAHANGQLTFLVPQQPVAGLPVSLYLNKARLQDVLKRGPNMCLQVGFNNWSVGVQKVPFRPTTLNREDSTDWWCCLLDVPQEATQGAFAICGMFNGHESWDNNNGQDYKLSVIGLEAAVVRAVAGACIGLDVGEKPRPRAPRVDDKQAQPVGVQNLVSTQSVDPPVQQASGRGKWAGLYA